MIFFKALFTSLIFSISIISPISFADDERTSILAPTNLSSPRQTLKTFIESMNDYKKGKDTNNKKLEKKILIAIQTLNLSASPSVLRSEVGKEVAIYLKEVIDRIMLIDYEQISEAKEQNIWTLDNTAITISKQQDGPNKNQFLFSKSTVLKAKEFYEKTKHLSYLPGTGKGANFTPYWYEKHIPTWANKSYFILPNWQWVALFLILLAGLFIKNTAKYLLRFISKFTDHENVRWQHKALLSLERPVGLMTASAFWFFAIYLFQFQGPVLNTLNFLVQVTFGVSLIWSAYRLTDILSDILTSWSKKTENTLDDHLVPMINKSLHIFVIVFGILILFQSIGFNVVSILAGLGLGGLAFALAAKDTCANFFGSLMILVDQPFKIGDWIITNDAEGTVEDIGFRSTRLRTFYKSLVSIPNSAIANMNIDNMGKREARRVNTTLGVTYDTPPEKIEAFLQGIKDIIKTNPSTDKDYFHVVFSGYGSSSLNIMLYFFLRVPDWQQELIEKQNVFLEILRLAQKIGVEFAFPTQTLHVESLPEQKV